MLEKIREFYDRGDLVAEVFRNEDFVVQLSSNNLAMRNYNHPASDYVAFTEEDETPLLTAISAWENVRDSLWRVFPIGNANSGLLAMEYYLPNEEEAVVVFRNENGVIVPPKKVGKKTERMRVDNLEFVFERIRLSLTKDERTAIFDDVQLGLIGESFDLWKKTKRWSYAYRNFDDLGFLYHK